MKRHTFNKLVALLRPALERDYCKNSVSLGHHPTEGGCAGGD